jgi:hypothetical protein
MALTMRSRAARIMMLGRISNSGNSDTTFSGSRKIGYSTVGRVSDTSSKSFTASSKMTQSGSVERRALEMCLHQRTEPVVFVNYWDQEIWVDRCKVCGVLLN